MRIEKDNQRLERMNEKVGVSMDNQVVVKEASLKKAVEQRKAVHNQKEKLIVELEESKEKRIEMQVKYGKSLLVIKSVVPSEVFVTTICWFCVENEIQDLKNRKEPELAELDKKIAQQEYKLEELREYQRTAQEKRDERDALLKQRDD